MSWLLGFMPWEVYFTFLEFYFFANKMRELICHISRTSSSKSLWYSLNNLDSSCLLPPRFESDDWFFFLPPQNILVPDTKIIQMYYHLSSIGLIFFCWSFACMPQVSFASLLYWKTKAHLCNPPLQLLA